DWSRNFSSNTTREHFYWQFYRTTSQSRILMAGKMKLKILVPIIILIITASGCGLQSKKGVKLTHMNTITVNTPAFSNGGAIPNKYAKLGISGGQNVSLPLSWSSVPGAKSYAIFMYDTNPV